MNYNDPLKIYVLIGKVLCGIAGGIVGFLVGGPLVAIPATVTAAAAGHLLQKGILTSSS